MTVYTTVSSKCEKIQSQSNSLYIDRIIYNSNKLQLSMQRVQCCLTNDATFLKSLTCRNISKQKSFIKTEGQWVTAFAGNKNAGSLLADVDELFICCKKKNLSLDSSNTFLTRKKIISKRLTWEIDRVRVRAAQLWSVIRCCCIWYDDVLIQKTNYVSVAQHFVSYTDTILFEPVKVFILFDLIVR